MKNIFLVLICFAYNLSAYAEGYSGSEIFSMNRDRGGGAKDGRGVGGGYAGHVKDTFLGLTLELIKISSSFPDKQNEDEGSYLKLSDQSHEQNNLDIDAEKFLDLIEQGKLRVVQEGDAYVPQGVPYNIVDGALYLNATIWDKKLMQGNYEVEVVRLLLSATNQADEGGRVSKYYGKSLKAKEFKDSFYDVEIKQIKFFE